MCMHAYMAMNTKWAALNSFKLLNKYNYSIFYFAKILLAWLPTFALA